jgi:histidinol-phosphate aminotransferase
MADSPLLRPALESLVPYEPGKPVDEVQRELGLDRVVKLASNEGQYGPFPDALAAIERGAPELNRYPDGGAYLLRAALSEYHGVGFENVTVAAGADAVIMYLSLALLDPGDEVVCGWPSFPSYVLDALKLGALPKRVPLTEHRYDVERILDEVGPRTKIVYLCNPNNPTGTMVGRDEVEEYFGRVPGHVLTVLDEAYFEYVEAVDYPDGIAESAQVGRRALVLRTFSKIYGLAGLRVGYGVGPVEVIEAIAKVRNAFDINQTAQDAARASIGNEDEIARRRRETAEGRAYLEEACERLGLTVASAPVANFVYVETGGDARVLFDRLLREGVIVRPLGPFGAAEAIRVTVGAPEENELFAAALERVLQAAETAGSS